MPDSPIEMEQLKALAIALGIGLLIGLERERVPSARAGVRTFGLVGLLGALSAMIGAQLDSVAVLVAALISVGAMMVAAYLRHPDPEDPGTTSVTALLVCFCLGATAWYGHGTLAVMLAVATTALLYFKMQLRGIATRLEPKDWFAILQFSVLSLVILPVLPNQEYGPYDALNPYQIWLMVVLICGVSLAGYTALQLVGARHGAALVGIFGGLASSTATTLIYARNARAASAMAPTAALVILLANLVMVVRVGVLTAAVAPRALSTLALLIAPALALGGVVVLWLWRHLAKNGEAVLPTASNPAELKTALGFGALYAVILLLAAWLADVVGAGGLYGLALVSGLTDVDAITLSSLRLFSLGRLEVDPTAIAVGLAMLANLGFKTALAITIGGGELGRRVIAGMGAVGGGLVAGIVACALRTTG